MGKGVLVGGIVLIVIGIIIASLSSAAQSSSTRSVSGCDSFTGQLGQVLSEQQRQDCANAAAFQSASSGGIMLGWGVVALGVVLAGVGGIQMARSSSRPSSDMQQTVSATPTMSATTSGKVFCRYCGKLRPLAGTNCSECGKPTISSVTERKKCTFCAASMSADSEFCANCGRKF